MAERLRSWATIKRGKVAEIRAYYFELTGQDETSPATKAGLIEEIEEIFRGRAARTTELLCKQDREKEARDRASWREENAKLAAQINSVFADFPRLEPL